MVSNMTEYIYAAIGVVLLLGVLFEAYRYLKGHPQALASLEAKVKAAEVKAQGLSGDVVAAIHAKLDSISTKVDATHAAALAPVTVTVVPATPSPKVDAPILVVPPAAGTGPTSQVPTGQPAQAAPSGPVPAPEPLGPNISVFGRWMGANYQAGVAYAWQITCPDGVKTLQFDISSCGGSTASSAWVTVKAANGTVLVGPIQANPNMWNCHFPATPGSIYIAEVTMNTTGPGIATIYAGG